jgi:hypothetical protein
MSLPNFGLVFISSEKILNFINNNYRPGNKKLVIEIVVSVMPGETSAL